MTARFALVGTMGPPGSQVISTIGETVNVCARLESLTKEYDCAVVVSRRAAEMAGLAVKGRRLHANGRVLCAQTLADVRVQDGAGQDGAVPGR